MKKLLLATAAFALLAPAAHAEIKLDLGGYFKGYAGYADQDTDNLRDFDIARKSEVFFEGETTLDNGLTVGYHGSLFQEAGDAALEESYLYFSGNWGRVNFGRENGAAYLLQVTAPGADANIDGADIDVSFYNPTGSERQEYAQEGAEGTQYSDKITYLTPKFNGFQAGVSYSPSYDSKGVNSAEAGMNTDNDNGDLEQFMEGSARYDGEFSGVGVHVGAGYATADQEVTNAGDDDFKQWNAGLKLSFEGFGLGAAYITDNGAADDADTDTWVVGGDYTYGAYNFGASYLNSENDDDSQLDRYVVGAGYTFGPGMKFNGSVGFYDEDTVGGGAGNDATVVAIGTDIQF